jgi:inosine/xanthosine triphosphatase
MKHVVVASTNPVKINAVKQAYEKMFPQEEFTFEGISVPSGVSEQPMSDEETLLGAQNRVMHVKSEREADFWVSIEAGVEDKDGLMGVFGYAVILSKSGLKGLGKTGTFYLPKQTRELILNGMELGQADDIVFKMSNTKQQNGTIGILTADVIDRTSFCVGAVICALIPFKNPDLY